MVVWLEDMKIRLYPIDERQNLRNIQNTQWEQNSFSSKVFLS